MKTYSLVTAALLVFGFTPSQADTIYVPYSFTNFVGGPGGPGTADGLGPNAAFHAPEGLACDSAGNIYVVDSLNYVIKKITPDQNVTTIAGTLGQTGTTDGPALTAKFGGGLSAPTGIAVDPTNNIYIADAANYTIRKLDTSGNVSTPAGVAGTAGSNDGTGSGAHFSGLNGLGCDLAGNLYIADGYSIRQMTPAGVVKTIAGSTAYGIADGTNSTARFGSSAGTLRGIAVDSATNIFVADFGNATIRKVSPNGPDWVVTTIAGTAGNYIFADGVGANAHFSYIGLNGITLDPFGNLYVCDSGNLLIRKISFDGTAWNVSSVAGALAIQGTADGTGGNARFTYMKGAAADSQGNIYVSDFQSGTIRKMTPATVVSTYAGRAPQVGTVDGIGSNALFYLPARVAVDNSGDVYIADTSNFTIRRANSNGVVTTLIGKPGSGGSVDGTNSVARLRRPNGMAIDANTNIYFADTGNDLIRKASPSGANWVVTTLAGIAQTTGTNDGIGNAARFNGPLGVAVDNSGNLYIADTSNFAIRKMTLSGTNWTVTTLAGVCGKPGFTDGNGTNALFYSPHDIVLDPTSGNFFVSDGARIRQVTPDGTVTSIIGCIGCTNALGYNDGTGSDIQPGYPIGIATDSKGSIYLTDFDFHLIRRAS